MDQIEIIFPETRPYRCMIRIGDEKFLLGQRAIDHKEARAEIKGHFPEARAVLVQIK